MGTVGFEQPVRPPFGERQDLHPVGRLRVARRGRLDPKVELTRSDGNRVVTRPEVKLATGWSDATVRFDLPADQSIDELRFRLPAGAELLADDVLLDTPGGGR
jgi:hypothetical protein